MTSFQSSELTELPVVENSQLFAQRAHSACTAHGTPPVTSRYFATGSKLNADLSWFPICSSLCRNGLHSGAARFCDQKQVFRA